MNARPLVIARHSCGDRAPFLSVAFENQRQMRGADSAKTFIVLDTTRHLPLAIDEFEQLAPQFDARILTVESDGDRSSWVMGVARAFEVSGADFILSVEDDVLLSHDFLEICHWAIRETEFAEHPKLLFLHAGAWAAPSGDRNLFLYSGPSSRAILLTREKFFRHIYHAFQKTRDPIASNDWFLSSILQGGRLAAVCPNHNRHAHIGVYGFSAAGKEQRFATRSSVFGDLSAQEITAKLRAVSLSQSGLLALNPTANPAYFWDFNPEGAFDPALGALVGGGHRA